MVIQFQRRARIDKKAFLNKQCKVVEENNRMGKTGDLFKEIKDTKRTLHAKMGTIKDINGEDRTEASDKQEAAQTDRRAAQKRPSRPR